MLLLVSWKVDMRMWPEHGLAATGTRPPVVSGGSAVACRACACAYTLMGEIRYCNGGVLTGVVSQAA